MPPRPRPIRAVINGCLSDDGSNCVLPLLSYRPRLNGHALGRTQFMDRHRVVSAPHRLPPLVREALFAPLYDELDLKRSHVTQVIGAWRVANPDAPLPQVIRRFFHDREALERDIQGELDAALPRLIAAFDKARAEGRVTFEEASLKKAQLSPKNVYSAILNVRSDDAFPIAIGGLFGHLPAIHARAMRQDTAPTICDLNHHLRTFRHYAVTHPLTRDAVGSLSRGDPSYGSVISKCMAHLEDSALRAAAASLHSIGVRTAISVNDSILVQRPPGFDWNLSVDKDGASPLQLVHRAL